MVPCNGDDDEKRSGNAGNGGWRGSPASLEALHRSRPTPGAATTTHGMSQHGSGALMKCRGCVVSQTCEDFDRETGAVCAVETRYTEARMKELCRAEGVDGLLDTVLAQKCVFQELLMQRGLRWLASQPGGGFRQGKTGPEAVPAVTTLLRIMGAHSTTMAELLQTPRERARLKSGAENPVALLYAQALGEALHPKALPEGTEEGGADGD